MALTPVASRPRDQAPGLLTPKAKAAFWDWVGDSAFAAVIAGCGFVGAAVNTVHTLPGDPKVVMKAAAEGALKGWLYGGIATLFVGPAIFTYMRDKANRFPFEPKTSSPEVLHG